MFTVSIETKNAAFEDWQSEVSRILRDIADKLDRHDGRSDNIGRTCSDINGNKVGRWDHITGNR